MGQIKITVDKNTWGIKVEGMGFSGNKCVAPLNEIEKLLDAKRLSRVPKRGPEVVKEQLKL
ncbi:hypothetical protein DRN93_02935 [archaeon]|nr:MAG: hypothetical protein DRN93_02935 [archaeon]